MIEEADDLYKKIKAYDPSVDGEKLHRAFVFGMEAHDGQTRASGEPYYTHPIAVANILWICALTLIRSLPRCCMILLKIVM